ncbi:type II toxin-antitoxin system ParD family antitoxin [Aphanothece hegewaldii CCALA 016]|uniref:Type II toxin-antitoxin system ParD family antitoxin n=1 Tax=Aphanothece hegewaldii CCALA 016 TaxID=2107694 RepID=A0A2T1LV05_9CHRO|nr:type II toxin-antitoxin system ParD family antitoxin [Aphanothece hegewaldii]PSF35518.1 type II toxin-antitoxin system ParD family antitoxin [Aphanothece hegewaldii CCALA 016]
MTNINIVLPESLNLYIDQQVSEGGYSTKSEYFLYLIRKEQKQKAQERLNKLLEEGLDSGKATPMSEQNWLLIRQAVRERVAKLDQSNQS